MARTARRPRRLARSLQLSLRRHRRLHPRLQRHRPHLRCSRVGVWRSLCRAPLSRRRLRGQRWCLKAARHGAVSQGAQTRSAPAAQVSWTLRCGSGTLQRSSSFRRAPPRRLLSSCSSSRHRSLPQHSSSRHRSLPQHSSRCFFSNGLCNNLPRSNWLRSRCDQRSLLRTCQLSLLCTRPLSLLCTRPPSLLRTRPPNLPRTRLLSLLRTLLHCRLRTTTPCCLLRMRRTCPSSLLPTLPTLLSSPLRRTLQRSVKAPSRHTCAVRSLLRLQH